MFNSYPFNTTMFNSIGHFIQDIATSLIVTGAVPLTSSSKNSTIQINPDVIGLSSLSQTVILR